MFYGILKEESLPSFATVNIEATATDGNLAITVNGGGSELASSYLNDASLTVYVVEDGIVGQQLNLGTWVNNYTHNHVLRDLVTKVVGDGINWTDGGKYENTYTVTLGSDWVVENLKVVAFISQKPTSATSPDLKNMAIYNANEVQVTDATGIRGINNVVESAADSYFTVDGRQVSQPQRGLNIVRMADGNTVKVLVK